MSSLHTSEVEDSTFAASDDVINNGEAWCSAVIGDPWDPAILTLDGGGIRGYSSLIILQALMHEISLWEKILEKEQATNSRRHSSSSRKIPNGTALRPDGVAQPHFINQSPLRLSTASEDEESESGVIEVTVTDTPMGDLVEEDETIRMDSKEKDDATAEDANRGRQGKDMNTTSLSPSPLQKTSSSRFDDDKLLPCHYFDFMYGTSTGGLIATMLGRLRMSVPQALEIYRDVGERLFGRQRSRIPLMTKYHHRPLEAAVQEIVRTYCKQHAQATQSPCDGEDFFPWDLAMDKTTDSNFNAHICQSICLTAVHNSHVSEAHLLRSYNHQYVDVPNWVTIYNSGAAPLTIWQVTRATSAAPFFFDPLETTIDGEQWVFKDGGIRENNPARAAWSEFISMFGPGKEPTLLLSIGTGRPDEKNDGFADAWTGPFAGSSWMRKASEKIAVLRNVKIKYTQGEDVHKEMRFKAEGEHKWYKRLNVSDGLEAMPLDAWKRGNWRDPKTGVEKAVPGGATLTQMEDATRDYLRRELDHRFDTYAPPRTVLKQVAERLVRQRRAREATSKGTKRWDTYLGKYLTGSLAKEADGPLVRSTEAAADAATKASAT